MVPERWGCWKNVSCANGHCVLLCPLLFSVLPMAAGPLPVLFFEAGPCSAPCAETDFSSRTQGLRWLPVSGKSPEISLEKVGCFPPFFSWNLGSDLSAGFIPFCSQISN